MSENKYIEASGYAEALNALPEPTRSQMLPRHSLSNTVTEINELDNRTLRIGNLAYTIKVVHNLRQPDGTSLLGQLDNADLTLSLSSILIRPLLLPTVMHEIYHAFCQQTGRPDDENEAEAFGYFISQLLTDNAWLVNLSYPRP
jgi:hypothetical protein